MVPRRSSVQPSPNPAEARIFSIERPHPSLMTYYFLSALALGPGFLIAILPLYFRYHTMRYRFDREGVAMRWGILFRKEVTLTYARIQDIHLTSNFVERWLGLARIQVQTASGSSAAEMTIEGLKEFEAVRDFLYARMRGIKGEQGAASPAHTDAPLSSPPPGGSPEELATALRLVAEELAAVRRALADANRGEGA
jgi:putative membrane protein